MIPFLALAAWPLVPASWSASAAPRSVILVVADGFGVGGQQHALDMKDDAGEPALPALRAFMAGARASVVATRSADSVITDSAAAATAIACGVKTRNGSLGVDAEGKPLVCLGQRVKGAGKALGLVTTTEVWDATPAAFGAHVANRKERRTILSQLDALDPEVLLGEDRPAPFPEMPHLSNAALHALRVLEKDPDGFFLLVETERTDEAGHSNDLAKLEDAARELDRTLAALVEYRARRPDVSLLLTSDHDTGGLGIYPGRRQPGWLTRQHTGALVLLFASGPGADGVSALLDNTELHGLLLQALGLPTP